MYIIIYIYIYIYGQISDNLQLALLLDNVIVALLYYKEINSNIGMLLNNTYIFIIVFMVYIYITYTLQFNYNFTHMWNSTHGNTQFFACKMAKFLVEMGIYTRWYVGWDVSFTRDVWFTQDISFTQALGCVIPMRCDQPDILERPMTEDHSTDMFTQVRSHTNFCILCCGFPQFVQVQRHEIKMISNS